MLIRFIGLVLLAIGVPSLYVAAFGALWQPPLVEYLGWLQLYGLRGTLIVTGVAATWLGLWYAWIGWTDWAARLWARYDDWKYARQLRAWQREQADFYDAMLGDPPQDEADRLLYGSGARDPRPEGWEACLACGQPINLHNPGEYDDECRLCDEAGYRPQLTLVQSDPLRHLERDDGCYTQGSDPVDRKES